MEIVRDLYRAFGEKDLDAIIAALHEDIVAEQTPGLPWGGRYEGRDGFGDFMMKLVSTIDSSVTIEQLFSAGDKVVQAGRTAGTVLATGAEFDLAEVHVITLEDGLVVRFEAHIDTPAMLEALAAGR